MASQIAALSNGSFGTAMELSQGDYKTELTQTFEEILEPNSALDAFGIAASLKGKKNMADHLLSLLTMYVRDLLVLKTDPSHPIFLRHYRKRMEATVSRTTVQNLQRAASVIQEVNESFQGNVNEQMTWERLMLGMHGVLF